MLLVSIFFFFFVCSFNFLKRAYHQIGRNRKYVDACVWELCNEKEAIWIETCGAMWNASLHFIDSILIGNFFYQSTLLNSLTFVWFCYFPIECLQWTRVQSFLVVWGALFFRWHACVTCYVFVVVLVQLLLFSVFAFFFLTNSLRIDSSMVLLNSALC